MMSIKQVKEFYDFTFQNEEVQRELIKTKTLDEFVTCAIKLGQESGYSFSYEEFMSTMNKLGETSIFDDVAFENEWIKKIMQIGWVPKGYTRE